MNIFENSKKIKKMLEIFSLSTFISIHRPFLAYHLSQKSLCLPRITIKSAKMQTSNLTISRHIKFHANLAQTSQL